MSTPNKGKHFGVTAYRGNGVDQRARCARRSDPLAGARTRRCNGDAAPCQVTAVRRYRSETTFTMSGKTDYLDARTPRLDRAAELGVEQLMRRSRRARRTSTRSRWVRTRRQPFDVTQYLGRRNRLHILTARKIADRESAAMPTALRSTTPPTLSGAFEPPTDRRRHAALPWA